MTGTDTQNGHIDASDIQNGHKIRVKFDPKQPKQTVPHEWAEAMLMWIFVHKRQVFGQALKHAAGVDE